MKSLYPQHIRSIVLRCPNWIGDAVMSTVTLERIRASFPNAHITAIARKPVIELFQNCPYIDDFFSINQSSIFPSNENMRLMSFLRQKNFDLGFLFTGSFSSALHFFRGNVREIIGLSNNLRRPFLTYPIQKPHINEHDTLTYQRLLSPLGLQPKKKPLSLWVTTKEKEQANLLLASYGHKKEKKLIIINPGAAYGSAKCWPEEYFKKVLVNLHAFTSITAVCIGDEKSAALTELLTAGLKNTINLSGKTTIRELMALISIANCLLTNDSGPMHIASACHVPLIALFGSTDPLKTGPLFEGTILYKKASCSPCFRRTCNKDFRCMYDITPEIVLERVKQILL